MSEDIFGWSTGKMLLASTGRRLEMLLNLQYYTEQSLTARKYLAPNSNSTEVEKRWLAELIVWNSYLEDILLY